jgi:broad specificity phosphatase PhoE
VTDPATSSPTGTRIHLVRHGEVENPRGIVYGRLPGYNLSERGRREAAGAAEWLGEAPVAAIWASPLERAQETAAIIAEPHGLEVVTDDRLTESDTTLEGFSRRVAGLLRSPSSWWSLRNPVRPSWGETFTEIRARMMAVISDAVDGSGGGEIVFVSHQTPVLVARLALGRRRRPPWLGFTPCETGSITSLDLNAGRIERASYFRPSA